MDLPSGFEVDHVINKVFKLKRSLYGLKQLPRAWFECFEKAVTGYGFSQSRRPYDVL